MLPDPETKSENARAGTYDEKSFRDDLRLAYRYRYFTFSVLYRYVPVKRHRGEPGHTRAGTDPYSQSQTHAPGPKYSTSKASCT